ncbi:MAG: adenylate kinase [Vulcanimicrobiaceae bacterium]
MDLIFLGPPGAGKGTQAQILQERFGFRQVSTGDMLRAHRRDGTELGKLAQLFMDKGELVPDDIIINMVEEELNKPGDVLFDGFPRTRAQAEALDELLRKRGRSYGVLLFDIPMDLLVERLGGRWSNPKTGRVYHDKFNPPKVDHLDDDDGTPLVQRDDDKPETVRRRLAIYEKETAPLVNYYGDPAKNRLTFINADRPIAEVTANIEKRLRSRTAGSPQ